MALTYLAGKYIDGHDVLTSSTISLIEILFASDCRLDNASKLNGFT